MDSTSASPRDDPSDIPTVPIDERSRAFRDRLLANSLVELEDWSRLVRTSTVPRSSRPTSTL